MEQECGDDRSCGRDRRFRESMGCDGPTDVAAGRFHIVGGERIDRCPMALLRDPWVADMVSLHAWWSKGQLGLVCRRPGAKVVAAIDCIESALARAVSEAAKDD